MGTQVDLQVALESILGSSNVYYQPPTNVTMSYPAIVYKRDPGKSFFANNRPYRHQKRYLVTIISKTPDLKAFDDMLTFPTCVLDRTFISDGLYHFVYSINY